MTVDELLGRISAAELTEWQAFEQVDGPLGPRRGDQLAALTAYYVVRALGADKAKFNRMVPQWDRPPQDWRQMQKYLKALTVAHGGTVDD